MSKTDKKAVDKAEKNAKKEKKEAGAAINQAAKDNKKAAASLKKAVKEGEQAIGAEAKKEQKKLAYRVGQIVTMSNGRKAKVQPNGMWRIQKNK